MSTELEKWESRYPQSYYQQHQCYKVMQEPLTPSDQSQWGLWMAQGSSRSQIPIYPLVLQKPHCWSNTALQFFIYILKSETIMLFYIYILTKNGNNFCGKECVRKGHISKETDILWLRYENIRKPKNVSSQEWALYFSFCMRKIMEP